MTPPQTHHLQPPARFFLYHRQERLSPVETVATVVFVGLSRAASLDSLRIFFFLPGHYADPEKLLLKDLFSVLSSRPIGFSTVFLNVPKLLLAYGTGH